MISEVGDNSLDLATRFSGDIVGYCAEAVSVSRDQDQVVTSARQTICIDGADSG